MPSSGFGATAMLSRRDDSFRPGRFLLRQRRIGRLGVVNDLRVPATLVALVNQCLQIQGSVGISPAQGDANDRQSLAQAQQVKLRTGKPRRPGDADMMDYPPRR